MSAIVILTFYFITRTKGITRETNIDLSAVYYSDVVKAKSLIDKTIFIKEICLNRVQIITAPRRFGKTINLDMLNTFFSIEVDKQGERITRNESSNYKLFVGNNLAIYEQEREFFDQHFGRYPVLFVDFTSYTPPYKYKYSVEYYNYVVRKSFEDHNYLLESKNLNDSDKSFFRNFLEEKGDDCDVETVKNNLKILSELLFRHYGSTKVFLLIDEFETGILDAMREFEKESDVIRIIQLNKELLSGLFEGNPFVSGGVLTGVSYIIGSSVTNLSYVNDIYMFLDGHRFVSYHGFTKPEVDTLMDNPIFLLTDNKIEKAYEKYDAYTSRDGQRIYCPWSILCFIDEYKVGSFWATAGDVGSLKEFLTIPEFKTKLDLLLDNNTVEIRYRNRFDLEDVMSLRNSFYCDFTLRNISYFDEDLIFTHLVELGYLSLTSDLINNTEKFYVKIPNQEIRESILTDTK